MDLVLGLRKFRNIAVPLIGVAMAACGGAEDGTGPAGYDKAPLRSLTQQTVLSPSNSFEGDWFGRALAIDGDTAAVTGNAQRVAVTVFTHVGGTWVEQQTLTPSEPVVDAEIALSGNTIALCDGESVYVFERSGTSWTQRQKLVSPTKGDGFGVSIALDGDTLVVGAAFDSERGDTAGAAYVFTRSSAGFVQKEKLLAADGGPLDYFGATVAVERDRVVIATPYKKEPGPSGGAAYVFARSGMGFTQQQKLTPAGLSADDAFGYSIALKGGTLAVGSPGDDTKGDGAGAAYVFTETNGTWTEQAKLVANDGAAGHMLGIEIAADGASVMAGQYVEEKNAGAAYAFARSENGAWTQSGRLSPSDPDRDGVYYFGLTVGISGATVLIGAPGQNTTPMTKGAAYVFVR